MSEQGENLQEVKTLREPQAAPTCCGMPMRKLSNASPSTGKILIVYHCYKCGTQRRTPVPDEKKAGAA